MLQHVHRSSSSKKGAIALGTIASETLKLSGFGSAAQAAEVQKLLLRAAPQADELGTYLDSCCGFLKYIPAFDPVSCPSLSTTARFRGLAGCARLKLPPTRRRPGAAGKEFIRIYIRNPAVNFRSTLCCSRRAGAAGAGGALRDAARRRRATQ